MRKELNSQRIGLGHQHGRRFIVLGHQYGHRDVIENTLLSNGQGSLMNLVDIFFITLQEYLEHSVKVLSSMTFSRN